MLTNTLRQETASNDSRLLTKIESYWDERSSDFSAKRQIELAGADYAAWQELLATHLPQSNGRALRILDIGTGAGFFAIILARMGCEVTGIDMSADMLHEAKQNALARGVRAKFMQMNAQELDFDAASFDVVVSRNLTWTLPDAMQAYSEWHRVLRAGGVLLNFDSDYGRSTFTHTGDQRYVHENIKSDLLDECTAIKNELRISTHTRPEWDIAYLQRLGMTVACDADIRSRVHLDPRLHHDAAALFAIYATK